MILTPEAGPEQPIVVVAEGQAEVAQLIRRRTANAWQVAGGLVSAGDGQRPPLKSGGMKGDLRAYVDQPQFFGNYV